MSASAQPRNLLLIAAAVIGLTDCSDPAGMPPPEVTAFAVGASNRQTGVAGAELPLPLQVKVQSDGASKAGVTVTWDASAGTITPASSLTDYAGVAATTWTLGTDAGLMVVSATVDGAARSGDFQRDSPGRHGSRVAASSGQTGAGRHGAVPAASGESASRRHARCGGHRVVDDGPTGRQRDAGQQYHRCRRHRYGDMDSGRSRWSEGRLRQRHWSQGSPVTFNATALPGPVASIQKLSGDGQIMPRKLPLDSARAGHRSARQWGRRPVGHLDRAKRACRVALVGRTNGFGGTKPRGDRPERNSGAAVVRATLAGRGTSVDFAFTVGASEWEGCSGLRLVRPPSSVRRTAAIRQWIRFPSGDTMKWTLHWMDYSPPSVVSVGSPSFQGGDFPAANPSTVRVTFTAPGTYHYADSVLPGRDGDHRGAVSGPESKESAR